MTIHFSNLWETTTRSSLISIGTHSLYLSTSRPPRTSGPPVIIHFTCGSGPHRCIHTTESLTRRFRPRLLLRPRRLRQQPLSVIRCDVVKDYRIMYEAGVKAGNGSEEEIAVVRQFIETWELFDNELRATQLRLPGKSGCRVALEYSHDVPIRKPEVIVGEVKWVLKELDLQGSRLGAISKLYRKGKSNIFRHMIQNEDSGCLRDQKGKTGERMSNSYLEFSNEAIVVIRKKFKNFNAV